MSGGGTGWLILMLAAVPVAAQVRVPFVGCESDGQSGLVPAPTGQPVAIRMESKTAKKLAYYKAIGNTGVLGPRGWYCYNFYGSSGGGLVVRPAPSKSIANLDGPAIIQNIRDGSTSGRFDVAARIAQVFPAYRSFVNSVRKSFELPANEFPTGAFPADKLTYRSPREVIFQTPPGTDGLGTLTGLKKNSDPIDGVSMLVGENPDLFEVAVRLPAELRWLAPVIISASTYK